MRSFSGRMLPAGLLAWLFFFFLAWGRVEVLFSMFETAPSAGECVDFVMLSVEDCAFSERLILENQIRVVIVSRQQIYAAYRALGTVPEWEIQELEQEDNLFPARAVLYLRSVSEVDGSVEGIMRV